MPDLYVRCKCCCCHNRSDCRVQFISIYRTCITIVLATFHPVSCSEGSVQIFPGKDLRPVYSDSAQLNSTELNSTAWTTIDSVCRSWRHKQKHDWLGCTLFNWVSWVQLSSVELCRYKRPFSWDGCRRDTSPSIVSKQRRGLHEATMPARAPVCDSSSLRPTHEYFITIVVENFRSDARTNILKWWQRVNLR